MILSVLLALASCTSVKKSISSTKTIVDSTVIDEKDSIIRVEKSKRERLESELRELQVTGISFDTIFLPGDTIINTVTVRTDGTVDATGRIKSVTVTNQKLQRTLKDLQEDYDSLAQVKQRVETKVITNTVEKTKNVKRTWPWWWFAICAVVGFVLGAVFRNQIISLFKIKSMKLFKLIAVLMSCFAMQGCGKYADGTSVWAGGLIIIPVVMIVGAIIFFVQAYKASKSGATKQTLEGGTQSVPGNVSIFKVPRFWFAVALVVAAVIVAIMVNADK